MPLITAPKTDKDTVKAAQPYIRSILAFILYTRDPVKFTVQGAYKQADEFTTQLLRDIP